MKLAALLSPTWAYANCVKNKKPDRTDTIKSLNSMYLRIAVASVIWILVYQMVQVATGPINLNPTLSCFLTFLWGYYLLSRCNEIFYAFLRDAFDKMDEQHQSASRLTPGDRIKLALGSYLELIINFAWLYALLAPASTFWTDKAPADIVKALYFSGVTITTLGYGDISPNHWWPQFLVIYEVFCGFTLLIVCFTIYAGNVGRNQVKGSHRVQFEVPGLPPKKDGANSMWGKPIEVSRICQLRRAAYGRLGSPGPFSTRVTLEIELHLPERDFAEVGDLDNFVAGVCDGLMAASGKWQDHSYPIPEWEGIQPSQAVAIKSDAHVVSIVARKVADATTQPWYRVVLTGTP